MYLQSSAQLHSRQSWSVHPWSVVFSPSKQVIGLRVLDTCLEIQIKLFSSCWWVQESAYTLMWKCSFVCGFVGFFFPGAFKKHPSQDMVLNGVCSWGMPLGETDCFQQLLNVNENVEKRYGVCESVGGKKGLKERKLDKKCIHPWPK